MVKDRSHGIEAKEPKAFLRREIRADFKKLTQALVKGGVDAVKGDWFGTVKSWSDGFVEGMGLSANSPEELAWRVVYTSLWQAVASLVGDNQHLLADESAAPQKLPDEIELAFSDVEIRLHPEFLTQAWKHPLLTDLQRPFARWLQAFGVDGNRAQHIAAQLPQKFGYCLWDEWAQHRDTYKPLEETLMVPVQRPPDLDGLRRAYLIYLEDSYTNLDLKGLPGLVEAVEKAAGLALSDVYVAISARWERPAGDTWDRLPPGRADTYDTRQHVRRRASTSEKKRADLIVLDPLPAAAPALVILGDPGSGKSTLLKHYALNLAADELAPLPILIPLNEYAEALRREPQSLRQFLTRYFGTRRQALGDLAPLFEHAVESGRALILLDGLDEVQTERGALVRRVEDLVREIVPAADADPARTPIPPGNRVVVTSRFVGYRETPLTDSRWLTLAVVDWDHTGIERFVERWTYAVELAIGGGRETPEILDRAQAERKDLLKAVFSSPHIERLAGNPLLLTILALIKRQGVDLPERRVELYEIYLRTLLESWRKARNLDNKPIGPEVDYLEFTRILAPLALWLRKENPEAGLIHRERLMDFLTDWYREEDELTRHAAGEAARQFLEAVHQYSSLLLEKGRDQFGFIHLTFEEYLAGKGLTLLPDEQALETILNHLEEDRWHETFLLGIGILGIVRQSPDQAGRLLERLLKADSPPRKAKAKIMLAYEALLDVGMVAVGRRAANKILIATMQGAEIEPATRRQVSLRLGKSGWLPGDLDLFLEVPSGKFLYGHEKVEKEIPYRYWIAKYPVTNAQYARYIEDGGYGREALWSEGGWAWLNREGFQIPRHWEETDRDNPLFALVGVSWYEAEAYANWLQERVRQRRCSTPTVPFPIPEGYRIRLPTEVEWESAARGTDGRTYPWGEMFDVASANVRTDSDKEKTTTAVCMYPQGESPIGAWDMAGNVWEWTVSYWGDASTMRVVRGGSWLDRQGFARCAYRGRDLPEGFGSVLGFRLVFSVANPLIVTAREHNRPDSQTSAFSGSD